MCYLDLCLKVSDNCLSCSGEVTVFVQIYFELFGLTTHLLFGINK